MEPLVEMLHGRWLRIILLSLLSLGLGVGGYAIAVPNSFTDGGVISAAQVNANFTDLENRLTALVPPGTVLPFAGPVAPMGFLLCDGTEVNRGTYAALYSTIGTSWGGGDGATTFHLPDLRGRFLRGVDGGIGRDPDAATRFASNVNGNVGDAVGSVQDHEVISHNHYGPGVSGIVAGPMFSGHGVPTIETNKAFAGSSFGGSETRPKNSAVNFIIKY